MKRSGKKTPGLAGASACAQEHPFASVAVALGAGYVLGGGLFTPLTAAVVRVAARTAFRLAVLPAVEGELLSHAQALAGETEA